MKHKTAELEGVLLDTAVAMANEKSIGVVSLAQYSQMWEDGGSIIEREKINTFWHQGWNLWYATIVKGDDELGLEGPTILIAAMRAYVCSKFGKEVELP